MIYILIILQMDSDELDLAQLRALDALLIEQHVTRAARRAGLSQPAMSRALARLRTRFGDDLLVRDKGGYTPTPRALALVEPVRRILRDIDALQRPAGFEPARSVRQFALAGLDFELQLLLPPLLRTLRQQAPLASLRAMSFSAANFDLLNDNEADLVITAFPADAQHYRRRLLYRNEFACVMSTATARRIGDKLSLERFVELRHGLVSFETRGEGQVDTALAELGLRRRVVLRVPGFLHVPEACAAGDVVFTLPKRVAAALPRSPRLVWMPAPLALPRTSTFLLWHPRDHSDPEHRWFREQVFTTASA